MQCVTVPGQTYGQAAAGILAQAAAGPYCWRGFSRRRAPASLVGINPGGYSKEALWTDHEEQEGSWRNLYRLEHHPPILATLTSRPTRKSIFRV